MYAQVRPCKSYPGVRSRFEDVDLVIVRENTEDLYAGIEYEQGTPDAEELISWIESKGGSLRWRDAGISIKPISVTGTRRIFEFAFDYARRMGRRKVTAVHKANIMKFSDGLWLHVAREVAAENPDVEFDDRIVDNMCMQLVQRPEEYDVLVLPNLYGDVLSDLCAGMIGGLGMAPGANYGDDAAVFEPTHGSAPKYAGQNKVNPMAQLLSGMLMLRHLGEDEAADNLERAIADVIREGERDLRHEADTRRPDRSRDERGRRRDHREARECASDAPEGHGRRRGERRRDVRAGARAARLRDVVLVDIKENLPQGKALDIDQMGAVLGFEPNIVGSNGYEETAGSDVVVITAGLPRSPGDEPRRPRDDEREDRRVGHRAGRRAVARRGPDRRLEPARRDVPRREERLGLAEGARVRHGGDPRHGALLDVHRVGDRRVGEGRDRDGARRPRRPDGPGRERDDRRRRPADEARLAGPGSRRWSSARARAAARS